ncbi:hypothetical protein JMA_28820 [Jeotgalibacillus malaysiensis]|uniref:Calcineurin-like phosphoesterase domain-containing protein n=1 Tax=Jeotgalibacillus malaysiensis TaxID=1508404 RepID=A0A0B5AVZ1_9BACL|nr:bifunctional UDP-sugar hydrolase/5'-nucleotidase [Jeotgalibacillus malaysiensis]AJD92199.1 hypothetical protein JMA_28820 [Jeotgalibacillus malaysiensis]
MKKFFAGFGPFIILATVTGCSLLTSSDYPNNNESELNIPVPQPVQVRVANITDKTADKNVQLIKSVRGEFPLRIIHSNDTHSEFSKFPQHAKAIQNLRQNSEHSLLLDAGDFTSANVTQKEIDSLANAITMNFLNYDVVTLGNHEFDQGEGIWDHSALAGFIEKTNFPVLSANVDLSPNEHLSSLATYNFTENTGRGLIFNGLITEFDHEKVGIFGITIYEDFFDDPGNVNFNDYTTAAKEAVAYFEEAGINKIIGLTHIGVGNDRRLAAAVPEIDIIIGGHSHVPALPSDRANRIGDTLVLQTGSYYESLGQLDVVFNKEGKLIEFNGQLHPLEYFETDTEAEELLNHLNKSSEVVGIIPKETFESITISQHVLNSLLLKANHVSGQTDFSILPESSINGTLTSGEMTYGDILNLLPFYEKMIIIDVTGKQIKQTVTAFEQETNQQIYSSTNVDLTSITDDRIYQIVTTEEALNSHTSLAKLLINSKITKTEEIGFEIFIEYVQSFGM